MLNRAGLEIIRSGGSKWRTLRVASVAAGDISSRGLVRKPDFNVQDRAGSSKIAVKSDGCGTWCGFLAAPLPASCPLVADGRQSGLTGVAMGNSCRPATFPGSTDRMPGVGSDRNRRPHQRLIRSSIT